MFVEGDLESVGVFQFQLTENSEIEIKEENDISYEVGEIISENTDQKVCDNVVISIDKMLEGLPPVNPKCNIIYQVPKQLREMNDKAYTPQFISLGPFHYRTQKDLIANEYYKLQGFSNFLRRIRSPTKDLVEKCHGWVKEAWNCYAEPIKMKEEEFIIMMLVDACFIVEFLLLLIDEYGRCLFGLDEYGRFLFGLDDKFFQIQDNVGFSLYQGVFSEILLDLIKLENQVPFFLLQNLFDLIPKDEITKLSILVGNDEASPISFIDLTNMFLKWFGFVRQYQINDLYHKKPKHFLHFLSFYFVPLPPLDDRQTKQEREIKSSETENDKMPNEKVSWRTPPPSITELCEAGVTIKVAENENLCFMNITFKNGVLEIPSIVIESTFEVLIRNLIAFDHYPAGNEERYTIQYVLFLDDLINTEQDVHLLVKAGVIQNTFGGSDKDICEMFNNFSKYVIVLLVSHFDDTSKALREHCDRRWNKAKASLKHNYFNTPWAALSFSAATFLLVLTILQTIFSAISTFPG